MTFNIVAMICMAGMSPADCGPEPGFSRDVAIHRLGRVEDQQDLAKSAPFRNLAEGEFIKVMCAGTVDSRSAPQGPKPSKP